MIMLLTAGIKAYQFKFEPHGLRTSENTVKKMRFNLREFSDLRLLGFAGREVQTSRDWNYSPKGRDLIPCELVEMKGFERL